MKAKGLVFGMGLALMFALAADAVAQAVRMSSGGRRGGTGVRFAQTQDDDDSQAAAVGNENTFTDPRGGQTYRTVRIGNRTWFAENININIQFNVRNRMSQKDIDTDSWCYDNDPSNCEEYGRLYTWAAAMMACPAEQGWRLPTNEDWNDLINAVGGMDVAGSKLKARRGWNNNGNGTDEFGFSALPGGSRGSDGSAFFGNGLFGFWWSASETSVCIDGGCAYYRNMGWDFADVNEVFDTKEYGLSVRCVVQN